MSRSWLSLWTCSLGDNDLTFREVSTRKVSSRVSEAVPSGSCDDCGLNLSRVLPTALCSFLWEGEIKVKKLSLEVHLLFMAGCLLCSVGTR